MRSRAPQYYKDKVIFITGASAGIGAALAKRYAAIGGSVALAARRKERLRALQTAITSASGSAIAIECDVTSSASMMRAVDIALQQFGRLDVVVINAGINVPGSIGALPDDSMRRIIDTNLIGALHTVQVTLPEVKKSRGTYVFINSPLGYVGKPNAALYVATKHALRGVTSTLRMEQRDLRIVNVAPGYVTTELVRDPSPPFMTLSADDAAETIIKAIQRGKQEIVFPWYAKLLVWSAHHLESTVPWIIHASDVARNRSKRGS
jgi:short-subunit dehydrogenase